MLLRIFRSRTSMLSESAKALFDAEFYDVPDPANPGASQFDDGVSVYRIEPGSEARAAIEHKAAAAIEKIGPPSAMGGVDLERLRYPATSDDPHRRFSFTNGAHTLLDVPRNEEGLRKLAQEAFELLGTEARVDISVERMRTYVRGKVAEADPEWIAFLADNPKWHKFADDAPKVEPPRADPDREQQVRRR